jgi:hypothetical protein
MKSISRSTPSPSTNCTIPVLGVWSSMSASRIRAGSNSAAWRTERALPSKSMSLLASGASAPISLEISPRKLFLRRSTLHGRDSGVVEGDLRVDTDVF